MWGKIYLSILTLIGYMFIISHKLDILDDKFPRKITVEKVKNFTQMVIE